MGLVRSTLFYSVGTLQLVRSLSNIHGLFQGFFQPVPVLQLCGQPACLLEGFLVWGCFVVVVVVVVVVVPHDLLHGCLAGRLQSLGFFANGPQRVLLRSGVFDSFPPFHHFHQKIRVHQRFGRDRGVVVVVVGTVGTVGTVVVVVFHQGTAVEFQPVTSPRVRSSKGLVGVGDEFGGNGIVVVFVVVVFVVVDFLVGVVFDHELVVGPLQFRCRWEAKLSREAKEPEKIDDFGLFVSLVCTRSTRTGCSSTSTSTSTTSSSSSRERRLLLLPLSLLLSTRSTRNSCVLCTVSVYVHVYVHAATALVTTNGKRRERRRYRVRREPAARCGDGLLPTTGGKGRRRRSKSKHRF